MKLNDIDKYSCSIYQQIGFFNMPIRFVNCSFMCIYRLLKMNE